MRNILKLAAVGLALGGFSAAAQAAPVGVTIGVTASMPPVCSFANNLVNARVGNDDRIFTQTLSYSCNFAGDLNVYLASANGGLVNEADSSIVAPYNINFAAQALGDGTNWFPAERLGPNGDSANVAQTGLASSSAAGATNSIELGIYLVSPLKAVGDYSDTVTVAVAP